MCGIKQNVYLCEASKLICFHPAFTCPPSKVHISSSLHYSNKLNSSLNQVLMLHLETTQHLSTCLARVASIHLSEWKAVHEHVLMFLSWTLKSIEMFVLKSNLCSRNQLNDTPQKKYNNWEKSMDIWSQWWFWLLVVCLVEMNEVADASWFFMYKGNVSLHNTTLFIKWHMREMGLVSSFWLTVLADRKLTWSVSGLAVFAPSYLAGAHTKAEIY